SLRATLGNPHREPYNPERVAATYFPAKSGRVPTSPELLSGRPSSPSLALCNPPALGPDLRLHHQVKGQRPGASCLCRGAAAGPYSTTKSTTGPFSGRREKAKPALDGGLDPGPGADGCRVHRPLGSPQHPNHSQRRNL